jgi:alkylhydroperoxidase/carboxymuconolactone decarboxylase family protein YurZ
MAPSAEDAFRRLTIGEPGFLVSLTDDANREGGAHRLDCRTESLLQVATLIAIDAPPASYRSTVEAAQQAGATLDDLLAVLLAVAGQVGSARVASAAPRIALAAGYDVEAALEELDRR